ncbi:quinone-dependent dihydroorotate dehydrogenase [Brevundimonas sp. 2R-24]|uniref:Dihydroorotate dehydrogenase (quinone) n=1 Tax=Peiella sedimenti TaxID=3061083 RepID=A0ABT8SN36_9CAUL|nr:quinone-dependent dihydroorotate dehydrogenase [Caulobacteraceae bacterium XZ-24]
MSLDGGMVQDWAAAALRRLDPETAHHLAIAALEAGLGPRVPAADPILATRVAGLDLPNCVGLAAGFDKDARVFAPLLRAGFGFVECGTVTPLPQPGNPRPRLFRLSEDEAIINRMGFNNDGVEAFAQRLARRDRRAGIVGANIGANKEAEDRIGDYVTGLKRLWGLADYFTANISSPNTPGLRGLQSGAALDELLGRMAEARAELSADGANYPLFLKVAPDLEAKDCADIAAACRRHGLDGVIVSNTTLDRPATLKSRFKGEAGGLSGLPVQARARQALAWFRAADAGMPLIAAGGVDSGAEAYARIRAGASAVQVYSALIYGGLSLVGRIQKDLAALLQADGYSSVAQAVGTAAP